MKKVLVITVTYNGMQWLERCLGSVSGADIFVVDNDSSDGSADWIHEHYPAAKLIRSAENLGFSKANNLGFEWALSHSYDYVYLLNQDAWLEDGAMEKLIAAAEEHPEYAVLSPLQMADGYKDLDRQFAKRYYFSAGDTYLGIHGHPRPCKREGPIGDGRGLSEAKAIPGYVSSAEPEPLNFVMAAHWLVRVEALRDIGLFNEELFPHWGQDDDWCNRARYRGWKVGIVPEARAVHDRAYRQEEKGKIIFRNYYMTALVALANPLLPLWAGKIYLVAYTLVKAVKYCSREVFSYFARIRRQLPLVVKYRKKQ